MRHKGLLVPLSRWYLWRVIPGGPGRSLLQSWHLKDGVGFDYSARRERLTTTSTCSNVVTRGQRLVWVSGITAITPPSYGVECGFESHGAYAVSEKGMTE